MTASSLITRIEFGGSPALFLSDHPIKCHTERSASGQQIAFRGCILLHGYGGRKEDMLPVALALHREVSGLSANDDRGDAPEGISCIIPDIPGHGENKNVLNIENVRTLISRIGQIINSSGKVLLIGHSMGSVIALNTGASRIVAISPPGEGFFDGNKKDMLRLLRARRVNEQVPYEGLKNILSEYYTENISKDCLLLYAGDEIRSVRQYVKLQSERNGLESIGITDSGHLDIVNSSQTIKVIQEYARRSFS